MVPFFRLQHLYIIRIFKVSGWKLQQFYLPSLYLPCDLPWLLGACVRWRCSWAMLGTPPTGVSGAALSAPPARSCCCWTVP